MSRDWDNPLLVASGRLEAFNSAKELKICVFLVLVCQTKVLTTEN